MRKDLEAGRAFAFAYPRIRLLDILLALCRKPRMTRTALAWNASSLAL